MGSKELIIVILTGLFSVISSYFIFAGERSNSESLQLKAAFERIAMLEEVVSDLTTAGIKQEIRLSRRDVGIEKIKESLDRVPVPVFLKIAKVEDGEVVLRNWYVNIKYRTSFGVSYEHYYNKTDEEIWGVEVGNAFKVADINILHLKTGDCYYELYPLNALLPISIDNPLYKGYVCKWYDTVEGFEAIVGAVVFQELYVEDKS